MRVASVITTLFLAAPALATLPATLALMAFSNGQQVGCINGYGKFTENLQWCYPFRAFPVTGTDDSNLRGYDYCSIDTGVLGCYPSDGDGSGNEAVFHQSGVNLATDQYGEAFSIAALPADASDNVGVPLIVGDSGAIELVLYAKAQSG